MCSLGRLTDKKQSSAQLLLRLARTLPPTTERRPSILLTPDAPNQRIRGGARRKSVQIKAGVPSYQSVLQAPSPHGRRGRHGEATDLIPFDEPRDQARRLASSTKSRKNEAPAAFFREVPIASEPM